MTHDFSGSLENFMEDLHNAITIEPTGLSLSIGQCIELYDLMKHLQQRKRIADRLQRGDVSEGMLVAGMETNCDVCGNALASRELEEAFKAMAAQLIKECEDA